MPIKVVAVSKPEFEQWLVQVKQKFASKDLPQAENIAAANPAAN